MSDIKTEFLEEFKQLLDKYNVAIYISCYSLEEIYVDLRNENILSGTYIDSDRIGNELKRIQNVHP